jgi:hypothetical protein
LILFSCVFVLACALASPILGTNDGCRGPRGAQAADRVYRCGQKKDVRIVRFVTEGTIEERIMELQDKKNNIIAGAMGAASKGVLQESRTSDLRMLFT